MPPQENFRKNAQGLLSIVLVGGESTIPAISRLELNMAGRVPVGIFRGAEGLIPPDISHLLESKSFWDMVLWSLECKAFTWFDENGRCLE